MTGHKAHEALRTSLVGARILIVAALLAGTGLIDGAARGLVLAGLLEPDAARAAVVLAVYAAGLSVMLGAALRVAVPVLALLALWSALQAPLLAGTALPLDDLCRALALVGAVALVARVTPRRPRPRRVLAATLPRAGGPRPGAAVTLSALVAGDEDPLARNLFHDLARD